MENLNISEIIWGYFEVDRSNHILYTEHLVNHPEASYAIRKYMDEDGIVEKEAVRRLISLGNPVENAFARGLIEYALESAMYLCPKKIFVAKRAKE
ncbi:MAG: hypothetical protein LBI15_02930 [Dysgonamonadaceae bacterium]|jgi:hypothetical protein|nr:hypothetical protein [Dysgonamonadaceae bacterium]